jgi:GNAT superfamily N-acetyltransferase
MASASMAELTVRPLTADRWGDFVRLFGERGVGGGCWCMFWRSRARKQYLEGKGEANKKAMRALVRGGEIPGLLGYDGTEPVGWCAVAPRESYPALARSRSRWALDGERVWSITCVYVARSHRRQNLSVELIAAAVEHVRSRGGLVVEGYPVPPKPGVTSPNYAYTGFDSAFEAAGFKEVIRRSETRPIVRYRIRRKRSAQRAAGERSKAQAKRAASRRRAE